MEKHNQAMLNKGSEVSKTNFTQSSKGSIARKDLLFQFFQINYVWLGNSIEPKVL